MKEFVEYIVKNLVDNPDKVVINEIGGTHTLIIELSVEKSDIGKIIGKKPEYVASHRKDGETHGYDKRYGCGDG